MGVQDRALKLYPAVVLLSISFNIALYMRNIYEWYNIRDSSY